MKRVVSVSIGSSKRDHQADLEVLGEKVRIERVGTDGDIERARRLMSELDGKVDAIGLGGISFYLYAAGRRYPLHTAMRLVDHVKTTPVVDGGGIKNTLEAQLPRALAEASGQNLRQMECLMVNAVERYALAKALTEAGCRMTFGDLIFSFGIPIPLKSLRSLDRLGRAILPLVGYLPFKMLYPTGESQEKQVQNRVSTFMVSPRLIAGDYHYIRRYMPQDLQGKLIITNTVTEEDRDDLRRRGVHWLATASPSFNGRVFATNVLEALIVAIACRRPEDLTEADYFEYAAKLGLAPRVEYLPA